MTAEQAKELRVGDDVIFNFKNGSQLPGEVTRLVGNLVCIEWQDNYPGCYQHDDMSQIEKVEA